MNYKRIFGGILLACAIGSSGVASAGGFGDLLHKLGDDLKKAVKPKRDLPDATFTMHGKQYTCKNIDWFVYKVKPGLNDDGRFFKDWTAADFDNGRAMARACAKWEDDAPGVVRELDERQKSAEARRKLERDRAKAEAERQECKGTKKYNYYFAAHNVEVNNSKLHMDMQDMREQKRIVRTSGVRDLVAERRIGQDIYYTKKQLKNSFKEYKRLGGKARSPDGVVAPKDPCESAGVVAQAPGGNSGGPTFTIEGKQHACANYFWVINKMNGDRYSLDDWKDADFDNARAMLKTCDHDEHDMTHYVKKLDDMQASVKRTAARNQCMQGKDYRYYSAAHDVELNNSKLRDDKQQMHDQKGIARESGVEDLVAERDIGEDIVRTRKALKKAFKEYKKAGGKAKSPDGVVAPKKDPCKGVGVIIEP